MKEQTVVVLTLMMMMMMRVAFECLQQRQQTYCEGLQDQLIR